MIKKVFVYIATVFGLLVVIVALGGMVAVVVGGEEVDARPDLSHVGYGFRAVGGCADFGKGREREGRKNRNHTYYNQ